MVGAALAAAAAVEGHPITTVTIGYVAPRALLDWDALAQALDHEGPRSLLHYDSLPQVLHYEAPRSLLHYEAPV